MLRVPAVTLTSFQMHFPSAFDSVRKARRALGSFAQACGFSSADVSDVVLAVGEACSNAVEHGHNAGGRLSVRGAFEDGILRIEIVDDGAGLDETRTPAQIPSPAGTGRGRGIPIMRAVMDAVSYQSGPAGTTVFLEKRLSARGVGEAGGESLGVDAGSPG